MSLDHRELQLIKVIKAYADTAKSYRARNPKKPVAGYLFPFTYPSANESQPGTFTLLDFHFVDEELEFAQARRAQEGQAGKVVAVGA